MKIKHQKTHSKKKITDMKNKDGRGRPLISKKGNQRRRNITIDDCTYKIIKIIGNGNFSQGVRKLYDQHSIIRKKEEKF